jgi:hypothetical protein
LAIVQAKIVDFIRSGVGLGIGFPLLDSIDKGKEIITKINGGVGDDKRADTVLDEFVPRENNIDLRKGEYGSEGIGWGVKDQSFNGGTLEGRSV